MDAHAVAAARRAHEALVRALRTYEAAEHNVVLHFADIYHRRRYRELGHSSIYQYAIQRLGFSESKTAQFVRLAKDVQRLPRLHQAIANREVSWTNAREVGKVATPETQQQWVDRAKRTSHRQLAREVRQARRPRPPATQSTLVGGASRPAADPPVRYGFDLTPLQAARLQALMEHVRPGRDRAELFLDALAALVEGESSDEKTCTRVQVGAQIVAYRCASCAGVDVPAAGDMKRLSPLEAAVVACDADQVGEEGTRRSAIPPSLRRRVLARDRHRCVKCGRTQFLQVHHRKPRREGGRHNLENCVTVCAPCHRVHHREEDALEAGVALERGG